MKIKTSTILLLIAGCGMFFVSCNRDNDIADQSPVAVKFGAANIACTKTTNGGDFWTNTDLIGIFMIKNTQTLATTNIVDGGDNVAYKADVGNSSLSTFSPVGSTSLYYPQNGDHVDFVAYYPYKTPLSNYTYPIDVSNQSFPENIDVLYANTAIATVGGYNKNSSTADLPFKHALSKLSFTLTSGVGFPNLLHAKVEITKLASTAEMNLVDGSVTATNTGQTLIANTATNGLSSSAIVIPQTLSGTKLVIALEDGESKFEWTLTTSEFLAGKHHQYDIIVNKTGISVSTGNITDWTGTSDTPTNGVSQKGYKVGDYYPDPSAVYENGVLKKGTAAIGVVFWLDNQTIGDHPYDKVSEHGKIVGLYEKAAANLETTWITNYGATYNAGTGWYMPAFGANDYDALYCTYNGMTYEIWDTGKPSNINKNYTERVWFRARITQAGGDNITDSWYWVSNRDGLGNAIRFHFNSGNKELAGWYLYSHKMRAIKSF